MWNELTFLWNDLTIQWNDLTCPTIWPWNELTGYLMYMYPYLVDLERTALLTMIIPLYHTFI